jgi:hypothetical protein
MRDGLALTQIAAGDLDVTVIGQLPAGKALNGADDE